MYAHWYQLAMAIYEVEREGQSIELEFRLTDDALFFVRASGEAGCRVTMEDMVHRTDGRQLEYFTVEDTPPDRVLAAAAAAPGIDDATLIREDDGEALFEFLVSGPCVGATLADVGAIVREVVAENGVGTVVADVPAHADAQVVIETVRERHDADLLARRERDRKAPEFRSRTFRASLADRLTDRQLEALRTAHASGYFAWPRERSAEECATALGITQPTFNQHLRAGEAKLVGALFDESITGDPFYP